MSFWGLFNETYGGPLHHGHFNPYIYYGLPITQVGHHRGAQVIGGFSATDPWLNSSYGLPTQIHHTYVGFPIF